MTTVAPWASVADVCAPCNAEGFDTDSLAHWIAVASEWLYHLSGQRWPGPHDDVLQPVAHCTPNPCGGYSSLLLPGFPVTEVSDVTIDGEALELVAFTLRDHRRLLRIDGARWPCCAEWTVAYSWGQGPPIGGVAAAAALGCELALACDPLLSGVCRLPAHVQAVTRQGVSTTSYDPTTLFPGGLVGIAEVDGWLSALRYGDTHRRGSVTIPRAAHGRVGR